MDKKLYINPPLVNRVYDWKNGPQPKTRAALDKFFKSAPIQKVKEQILSLIRVKDVYVVNTAGVSK